MTHSTTGQPPRNIIRTWKVRIYGYYEASDSTGVFLGETIVTLGADEHGKLFGFRDGVACAYEDVVYLLAGAMARGQATLFSEQRVGLTKGEAHDLHRKLGCLGVRGPNHYLVASAAVGREITSFTDLLYGEIKAVIAHASALMGGEAV